MTPQGNLPKNTMAPRGGFFDKAMAEAILRAKGPASVITANNVFAHADDLAGIADGITCLMAPDGIFVFEVSYLADVIEKTLFDTIYHEHISYHTVKPLSRFFKCHGLEMIAASVVDTHGGSLRGVCQRTGGPHLKNGSVEMYVGQEHAAGLNGLDVFKDFAGGIETLRHELIALLEKLKTGGKTIAGYGAPAKATTLMYHFGIGPEFIDFIVDDSPLKQGLYSPGLHIPVLPRSEIEVQNPDYLIILAWNFADAIIANNQNFVDSGGHFIVPLPHLEIH